MSDSQTRGSWWGITINNPTDDDFSRVKNLPSFVRYVKGQSEIGEEKGTLHIQAVANTAQVRMTQMNSWLPRAFFKVLKTKDHQKHSLGYVWKEDTAVPNTRFEAGAVVEKAKTFDDILYDIADYLVDNDEHRFCLAKMNTELYCELSYDKCIEKEFNLAVKSLAKEDLSLVSLLVRPDLYRAWKLFRDVFMERVESDRQTSVKISET